MNGLENFVSADRISYSFPQISFAFCNLIFCSHFTFFWYFAGLYNTFACESKTNKCFVRRQNIWNFTQTDKKLWSSKKAHVYQYNITSCCSSFHSWSFFIGSHLSANHEKSNNSHWHRNILFYEFFDMCQVIV